MKKFVLLVAVISMVLASCATFEVVNGVPQDMGIITKSQLDAKPVIASYWQLGPALYGLNLILNFGYKDFLADTKGKSYDIQVKQYWMGFIGKVSAVER